MPHLWTLQTQYLVLYPIEVSRFQIVSYTTVFLAGWYMRHIADDQKSRARASHGNAIIWGQKAKCLQVDYQTSDGKTHRSLLLHSGMFYPSPVYKWNTNSPHYRLLGHVPACKLFRVRPVHMAIVHVVWRTTPLPIHGSDYNGRLGHTSLSP